MMTALFGLPGLAFACLLYFVLALMPGLGRAAFATASIAVVAIYIAAIFFWEDAKGALDGNDAEIGYAFFALHIVLLVLYLLVRWRSLSRRFPDQETPAGGPDP